MKSFQVLLRETTVGIIPGSTGNLITKLQINQDIDGAIDELVNNSKIDISKANERTILVIFLVSVLCRRFHNVEIKDWSKIWYFSLCINTMKSNHDGSGL